MNSDHYRRLEHAYHAAPCHTRLRPEISISHGRATVRLGVEPEMFHAMNAVHGSFYFKMLDDAAFFAANSVVTDVFVLTVSFSVRFLRPVTSGVMTAEGTLVKHGHLLFADSILKDGSGRELARGSGVFARSRHLVAAGAEDARGSATPVSISDIVR